MNFTGDSFSFDMSWVKLQIHPSFISWEGTVSVMLL